MLYRSMVPILLINLLVSSALAFALWDVVSHTTIVIWLSLMIVMILFRAVGYISYRRYFTSGQIKKYGNYLIIGSAVAGLIWGIGGAAMLPMDNREYQLFVLFVLMSMGVGSTSSLYIFLPAFFAFFPILILPASIKLLYLGGTLPITLGLMSLIYVVAISFFNINLNRTLKESFRLRFENVDLVEQLREQKKEADNANLAKSKFLAAASHDLRQPLYALSLFTSVLEELVKAPEILRVVAQIKTSGDSMKSMFNTLLNISQLDAGVMNPEKTNFLLQPLFNTLANNFDPLAKQKNILMHWPTEDYAVHSDRELVEQILRNFISNAIRYTDEGSITIHCKTKSGQLIISVSDTGIGISEDNKKVVFEEYKQIGNPERDQKKGLGLGLAIVQRTAELLQHEITVESQLNQGSKFSISIEQAEIEDCEVKQNLVEQEQSDAHADTLIVVIDDDTSVLEGTQILFENWGCNVITATNQEQALTLLKQKDRTPDGIIADYRLRNNETGITAIHSIHAKYHGSIPALIVTGDIAVDRLKNVDRSGIQMLPKPISTLKLRTFLRNVEKFKSEHI